MDKDIFLFTDLDDTLWQTKRKIKNFNKNLKQVTTSSTNPSFMKKEQELFSELFLNHPNVSVIPITARELSQYKRTFLYDDKRIQLAIIYFCGVILYENKIDTTWQKIINNKYAKLNIKLSILKNQIREKIKVNWEDFKFRDMDGFYLNIKHKDKSAYKAPIKEVFETLLNMQIEGFSINSNDNNIAILPNFLNKEMAIEYIIDRYNPKLTLGAGDSLSDFGFMQKSHYIITPNNSQIINHLKKSL